MRDAGGLGASLRTVRYLKPRQALFLLRDRLVPARFDLRPAPPLRVRTDALVRPVSRRDGWVAPRRAVLLNREREFGRSIDWAPGDASDLWTCTLHYFCDLPGAVESGDRPWLREVVEDWIAANPPGTRWAWNVYATSRRIVNWSLWILAGADPPPGTLDSLAVQLRHVANRIEYHLLGNHVLANAVALVVGGLLFAGSEGDRWLRDGLALLLREIEEQILPDGGHFERSPMYQGVIIEDLLNVLNVSRAFPDTLPTSLGAAREEVGETVRRMLAWLAAMTHTDGEIAFFNDSAQGVAATYGELCQYSELLGVPVDIPRLGRVTHLRESGYIRLASSDLRTLVFLDVGPVGPDYQPGHAHCDTLSVEISRNGRRLVVNSGTSTYERGEERLRERATAAHTTVRVDGAEQSEVWASHRCGRRAYPLDVAVGDDWTEGAHDGYRRLPGRPLHRRRVTVDGNRVVVRDTLEGEGEHHVEWFFHVHPDVVASVRDRDVSLEVGGAFVGGFRFPQGLDVRAVPGTWHPGFNRSRPNTSIVASTCDPLPLAAEIVLTLDGD